MNEVKKNIPTVLVIFGATGDLMTKKITPALYNLFLKGKLPKMFRVVGFARRDLTREAFQKHVTQILETNDTFKIQKKLTEEFLNYFYYHQGHFDSITDYNKLATDLGKIDGEWRVCSNKLFYTAVPPQYYETIFRNLHDSGLTIPCGPDEGWTRVLVEKPFGKDAKTAEKLDLLLAKLFREEQIYRIDHYLAKEMLQNILSFRFSNNILEENWNAKYIEKIDIRLWEKIGVEKRGIFYDGLGALRDVGQNHLLQMLAFVTMEHPQDFTADSVRTKRAAILQTLIPPTKDEIISQTIRAQHEGFTDIKDVKKNSKTETYFKIRGFLNSSRWRGVPITMESGKRMEDQIKDIIVTFKHATPCLCPVGGPHLQDKITFSLEPEEGIEIQFLSKKPGLEMQIEQRKLEFVYRKRSERVQYVEEYEKLLLDCIEGSQLLFLSTDEVKAMWRYIDPIVHAWDRNETELLKYEPDSDDILKQSSNFKIQISKSSRMHKEVGVVGLGKMGANVSRSLLEKGWKVVGWNRTDSVTK
ncbi:MAG: glucose-6-phosphate dehydrogenase, partial [Patescibacteria group bacterium]